MRITQFVESAATKNHKPSKPSPPVKQWPRIFAIVGWLVQGVNGLRLKNAEGACSFEENRPNRPAQNFSQPQSLPRSPLSSSQ